MKALPLLWLVLSATGFADGAHQKGGIDVGDALYGTKIKMVQVIGVDSEFIYRDAKNSGVTSLRQGGSGGVAPVVPDAGPKVSVSEAAQKSAPTAQPFSSGVKLDGQNQLAVSSVGPNGEVTTKIGNTTIGAGDKMIVDGKVVAADPKWMNELALGNVKQIELSNGKTFYAPTNADGSRASVGG